MPLDFMAMLYTSANGEEISILFLVSMGFSAQTARVLKTIAIAMSTEMGSKREIIALAAITTAKRTTQNLLLKNFLLRLKKTRFLTIAITFTTPPAIPLPSGIRK